MNKYKGNNQTSKTNSEEIQKKILKGIENTNTVIARAENLSNSSLKTDDRSSGLVQTLKQFGNNDELLMSR